MAKLLLDETFFERDNTDNYIDEIIKFIDKYLKDDIVFFHPYCNPGNLWMLKNEIASIEMKVMKKGRIHICDLNSIINSSIDNNFLENKYSNEFINKIKYICDNFTDVIIFNAPENHHIMEKHPCEHVYLINHIKRELDSNISLFIVNKIFMNNIIEPTLDSPLPNVDLCNEYKDLQNELIKGKDNFSRIPIYLQIGKEVLQRNSYIHNKHLSSINTTKNKIRDIYQKNDLSIYGCIDIENGSIEICDHNGRHKDEFGFDNQTHNKHDSTGKHNIKLCK